MGESVVRCDKGDRGDVVKSKRIYCIDVISERPLDYACNKVVKFSFYKIYSYENPNDPHQKKKYIYINIIYSYFVRVLFYLFVRIVYESE